MNIEINFEQHFMIDDSDNKLQYIVGIINGAEMFKILEKNGADLFSDNVRAYLGNKTTVNKSIQKTISENPAHFFPFNNGITIIANQFKYEDNKFQLLNGSVINGAQSISTIFDYYKKDKNLSEREQLEKIKILSKIVIIENTKSDFSKEINKNVNTQNTVKASDYLSNDDVHHQIKDNLEKLKVYYEIKRGDVNLLSKDDKNKFNYIIKKEDFFRSYFAVFESYGSSNTSSNKIFKVQSTEEIENDPNQIHQLIQHLNEDFKKFFDKIWFANILVQNVSEELKNFDKFFTHSFYCSQKIFAKEELTDKDKKTWSETINSISCHDIRVTMTNKRLSLDKVLEKINQNKFDLQGKGKYFYAFLLREYYEMNQSLNSMINVHDTKKMRRDLYQLNLCIKPIILKYNLSENKITMSYHENLIADCLEEIKQKMIP